MQVAWEDVLLKVRALGLSWNDVDAVRKAIATGKDYSILIRQKTSDPVAAEQMIAELDGLKGSVFYNATVEKAMKLREELEAEPHL